MNRNLGWLIFSFLLACSASAAPSIQSLTLVNVTKETRQPFVDGMSIPSFNPASGDPYVYYVEAQCNPPTAATRFQLDADAPTTARFRPFRSQTGAPGPGPHKERVVPLSANGSSGAAKVVSFTMTVNPVATPSPTPNATPTPTPIPTPSPTATPTATPTASPSASASVTPLPSPSVSPSASLSPSPTATATPVPPTATPTPTVTPAPSPTPSIAPGTRTVKISWDGPADTCCFGAEADKITVGAGVCYPLKHCVPVTDSPAIIGLPTNDIYHLVVMGPLGMSNPITIPAVP